VVERASARETAARVAAGSIAQQFLEALGVRVLGHVLRIGGVDLGAAPGEDLEAARGRRDASEHHALGPPGAQAAAAEAIDRAHAAGDTLGGVVEVVASGVPVGLGGHERPEGKLSAGLARAVMGVQAVRGVELGLGFRSADLPGSQVHDSILPHGAGWPPRRGGNHAGGIEGGLSNGQPIVVRAAMKPLATLRARLPSVDLRTGEAAPARFERSDTSAVSRLAIVLEAVVAAELCHHVRRRFGGASLEEVRAAIDAHVRRLATCGPAGPGVDHSGP
jgi:chorismate synthase